ncbi:MAG: serine hydrolase [Planctomycetota bacterium]|nr:serine hydrolase [Planctomycetota bacterium]
MRGAPPPADRVLRFEDGSYFRFPAMRWSVSNFRQLMPTVNVSRGLGAPRPLPRALREDIDAVRFTPIGSETSMTWGESLAVNYTDGIVVLHRGRIVYERYFGVLREDGQHGCMSVTKSFVGTLGAVLVAEGTLDPDKRVREYVPELAGSAFGDATIRQVLDMTTGLAFSEDYSDPNAEIWAHARAGNPLPKPKGFTGPRTYFEFLQTVKKQGEHGAAFAYKTANTDALAWVLARVTGQSVAELVSRRIWRRLGAEQDAYFSVDSIGTPFAGGGLNTGLRDLARFGELMRNGGKVGEEQILPAAAVDDIRRGASREAFAKAGYTTLAGWSYRSMWWISHNEHDAFAARGVHGQTIYVDPKAEMVIARFASHPSAKNAYIDPTSLPAYHALAKHLLAKPR